MEQRRSREQATQSKIVVGNVSKLFGATAEALALVRAGKDKTEIRERTGSVVGVADVSFEVGSGETFVVMGLSGSGKSTLLRCLNRLIVPTDGSIQIDGEEITAATAAELRRLRLGKIAMVFQHFALLPHRTVGENVEYGLKVQGVDPVTRRRRALETLDLVGLESWADSRTRELSGGMQQRVGLARALAVDPDILLMDEPFSALDPLIRRDMQDELIALQRRFRKTIVFITHDLHEALKLGDRVAIMKEGRFVQVGAPEEIVARPANSYVSAFTQDVDSGRILPLRAIMSAPAAIVLAEIGTGALSRCRAAHAPIHVLDDQGRPIGLVGRERLAQSSGADDLREAMQRDFPRAGAEESIATIYGLCRAGLPIAVTDDDGRLVGTVEPLDVFAALEQRDGKDAGAHGADDRR